MICETYSSQLQRLQGLYVQKAEAEESIASMTSLIDGYNKKASSGNFAIGVISNLMDDMVRCALLGSRKVLKASKLRMCTTPLVVMGLLELVAYQATKQHILPVPAETSRSALSVRYTSSNWQPNTRC
jgi:hypothetical protein